MDRIRGMKFGEVVALKINQMGLSRLFEISVVKEFTAVSFLYDFS